MNSNKKVYMTPMLEVMNARVEKGFAGSGSDSSNPLDGQLEPVVGSGDNTGDFEMD